MFKLVIFFWIIFSFNLLHADIVYFKSGKIVEGNIVNYKDDYFELLMEKERIKLIKKEIYMIVLESNKPSLNFISPQKTFEFWKKSAIKKDLFGLSLCYEKQIKADKLKEFQSFSPNEVKEMSKKTKKSDFSTFEPVIVGDRATMRVERMYKKEKSVEFMEFVIENGEWKISEI